MTESAIRYTLGGDEFLFAEVSEAMSLEAFFRSMLITAALQEKSLEGVTEICPANASFQVRYNPDIVSVDTLRETLDTIDAGIDINGATLSTRVIRIPVLYNDPWTHETLMRFRERHQDPSATDLEYAARINGYDSIDTFIEAHSATPWFVSMVGFVAGLPFMYQMVERSKQIQVPKYLSPRTDTPRLTVGYGGCFACIYSVRGAGGYQMFGVTPIPIYDPDQEPDYLKDSMILFRPGDIVKFEPIDRARYDADVESVAAGTYRLETADVTFSLEQFLSDPQAYPDKLLEVLNVH